MTRNEDELTLADELLLQAYLDGELPPEQQQIVAARLAQEPGLTTVLHQWRTLQAELDALPEPQLTHDLTTTVLARLETPTLLPTTIPGRTWQSLLAVQFALALLTVLVAWPLWAKVTAWSALYPALPSWDALTQSWSAWWAVWWQPDVWRVGWTAVWSESILSPSFSLPLSLLLPLATVTAVLWLITVRFTWRAAQQDAYGQR